MINVHPSLSLCFFLLCLQTPLHLACLRGHTDVVKYLMHQCHADVLKKDKNGQLPLEIAAKKQHWRTEWSVRRYMYAGNYTGLIRSLGGVFHVLRNQRVLSSLLFGTEELDMMVWPWRVVAASNFLGTLTTLYFASEVVLLDFYWWHLAGCMIWIGWWFCFLSCLFQSPGVCVDNVGGRPGADLDSTGDSDGEQRAFLLLHRGGSEDAEADAEAGRARGPDYSFEEAMNLVCEAVGSADPGPAVCYTCKLRKPLRSKHCKLTGRCVHKFDHFCPFVGT